MKSLNGSRVYDGDLASQAYHELGHAYGFRFYGYKVDSIEIGDGFGCTVLPKQTVNAFHYVVALHCGRAAINKWYGWQSRNDEGWLKSSDHARAYRAALKVSGDDHENAGMLMRWAEKRAEVLIGNVFHCFHEAARTIVERRKVQVL